MSAPLPPALAAVANIFRDPPPEHIFEISPECLSYVQPGSPEQIQYRELPPGAVQVSPLKDNVVDPLAFKQAILQLTSGLPASKKPRPAALILPDFAARLQVLDFDTFPSNAEEQQALVRFRMKKTIPFDVESAAVSYYQQPSSSKKVEVVAALMSLEITGRYEAPFRECGFHPGLVTTSALSSLDLMPTTGLNLVAKLSGGSLTLMVLDGPGLRLVRCVELEESTLDELSGLIYPTLVFVEDELKRRPEQLLLCGFGSDTANIAEQWQHELGIPAVPLQSRYGALSRSNAGLLGYLQGVH
jgi:type IV pilus assembly protein PilM